MNKHRSVMRWCAGALAAGALFLGAAAPAQADTGWNGTKASRPHHSTTIVTPKDTGWNGT